MVVKADGGWDDDDDKGLLWKGDSDGGLFESSSSEDGSSSGISLRWA